MLEELRRYPFSEQVDIQDVLKSRLEKSIASDGQQVVTVKDQLFYRDRDDSDSEE